MRILFWCDAFWPAIGGIPVLAAKLVFSLAERGHELHVVADEASNKPTSWDPGIEVPITRFPFLEILASRSATQIANLVGSISILKRTLRPDIVLIFTLGPSVLLHLQTRQAWPSPSIVTVHGGLPMGTKSPQTIVTHALLDADWVMTCSQSCLNQTVHLYPFVGCKASVALNALTYCSSPTRALKFAPPRLLYVGRLSYEKGVDVAISALRLVLRRAPDAYLLLAGDGHLRDNLRNLADHHGLSERIAFLGFVPPEEVRALMSETSIVLVPSRSEGFSLVALEAAQMGRPVVAARVGGIPEVVFDGQTGLLVPADDVAAFAEAILKLIENPARSEAMAVNARVRAHKSFRWSDYVDTYDHRIRSLGGD